MKIEKIDNGYLIRFAAKKDLAADFSEYTYSTYAYPTLAETLEFIENNEDKIESDC